MRDRTALREALKTVLICLLLFSALFLAGRSILSNDLLGSSGLLSSLGSYLHSGSGASVSESAGSGALLTAARPFYICVTDDDGDHHAVKYDAELENVYSTFSAALGEALGSAGEPQEIDDTAWREALNCAGVYFDYLYPQTLGTVARWLGTEMGGAPADDRARRVCLSSRGGELALYYRLADSGAAFRCSTALNPGDIAERLAAYSSRGDVFAYEAEYAPEGLDPYFILLEQTSQLSPLSVTNPFRAGLKAETVMEAFGMNSVLASGYTAADGTEAYVESGCTLKLDSLGVAVFFRTGAEPEGEAPGESEAVQTAYSLLLNAGGRFFGDVQLQLSSAVTDESSGVCTVTFEYAVRGVPLALSSGPAATVAVGAAGVESARIVFKSVALLEGHELVLPELQAAAIVAERGGGEPLLCYECGTDSAAAGWVIN